MVPTQLIRITRYYMITAVAYLLITFGVGITRALFPLPNTMLHWAPAVLGWVSFPIMGAYYQFFPTLQGRNLLFERYTIPQYILANLGVLGMMAGAWFNNTQVMTVGTLIYVVAGLIFAAIIVGNVDPRKLSLSLRFYLASLTYFVAALLLLGLKALALQPVWVTQTLILHMFVFGWAIIAIMGGQYSMAPMLQLKELRHPKLADVQFVIVNLGFWGLVTSFAIWNLTLTAIAGSIALIGISVFVYIIFATIHYGPARLPHLDISVKFFLLGGVYLILAALLGILMAAFGLFQYAPVHFHIGLIGGITMTIMGAMYHIVPFVVWWEVYTPKLGIEDVPLLGQLYDKQSAGWQLYGVNAGLLLMIVGFILQVSLVVALGGAVLFTTAVAFAGQMIKVLGHRRRLDSTAGATKNAFGGM